MTDVERSPAGASGPRRAEPLELVEEEITSGGGSSQRVIPTSKA